MTKPLTVTSPKSVQAGADVRALVDDWHAALDLQVRAGELAAATRGTYMRGLEKFLTWARDRGTMTDDTIRQWKADLLDSGYKPGAVNVWLSGVRAFFEWAVSARRLPYNPATSVKSATRKGTSKAHKRAALTDEEVRRVLAAPDRTTDTGKRDYAILAMMAYTAARTVELHRADLDDLETVDERLVLNIRGKGRREADEFIVLASPEAESAVRDWLTVRGDEPGPLFTSLSNRTRGERLSLPAYRRMVKEMFRATGVRGRNKTAHSLRHTAITNAVRHGAPVQKVQAMARHANISTTMIYYHETDRIEDPAEQYVRYNGTR